VVALEHPASAPPSRHAETAREQVSFNARTLNPFRPIEDCRPFRLRNRRALALLSRASRERTRKAPLIAHFRATGARRAQGEPPGVRTERTGDGQAIVPMQGHPAALRTASKVAPSVLVRERPSYMPYMSSVGVAVPALSGHVRM
jgi:hypothetical protein